jgi:hypothetical protein
VLVFIAKATILSEIVYPEVLLADAPFELRLGMILKAGESGKSFVNSNLALSQPKFSPSQETTPSFVVEFRALRTVDPVRGSDRGAPTAELGYSHRRDFPRRTRTPSHNDEMERVIGFEPTT